MKTPNNEQARRLWLERQLKALPARTSLLDVGAGECQYKEYCSHLDYVSQDVAQYDGGGNDRGLQMGEWDFSRIDLVCDLLDIPEDRLFDTVLCTEVLEHVPDAAASIRKLTRLVKPGGTLIITAPFSSLTHFAPYHYATGFSEYFYRHHLEAAGYDIDILEPNGGYFDFMVQELARMKSVSVGYDGKRPNFFEKLIVKAAREVMKKHAGIDGPRDKRRSAELLTFGWHVKAKRRT